MPILDIQKRARELGRIRIGQKGAKGQPQKLDRFRLTSASKPLLEKVAELYGGTVAEWDNGGVQQWEVITDAVRLPIMVPPQPVSQWYETWTAGGCVHRCDGQTDWITGETCDNDSPIHQQAKPTTRLNVVLRDVEGIGVWRLESHGWNAAVELPQAAEFLAQAGGYVNGWVALEQRVSKSVVDGKAQTRRFIVPTIEIDVTPAQLMAGEGRVQTPALEGPVRRAIEAGPSNDGPGVPQHLVKYYEELASATTSGECLGIYQQAKEAGHLEDEPGMVLYRAIGERGRELAAAQEPSSTPASDEPVDGEVVNDAPAADTGDPDYEWQQVLKVAGEHGMSLSDVTGDFEQRYAMDPGSASAGELAAYRRLLESGEVVSA